MSAERRKRRLGKSLTGAELPFLLIRAHDWVEENRSTALELISLRVDDDYARHLLTWLPLVQRLSDTARADHSDTLNAVRDLLARPSTREVLYAGFASSDKFVRLFCFELALGTADVDRFLPAISNWPVPPSKTSAAHASKISSDSYLSTCTICQSGSCIG